MPTLPPFEGSQVPAVQTRQAREYVVGVGANLGSRVATVRAAVMLLDADPAVEVASISSVYESEALGPPGPPYLNLALRLSTELGPDALWERLSHVETSLGRERGERWASRTLDLDVLWCGRPIHTRHLQVPHRELEARWFALAPLLEVAPACGAAYRDALDALGGVPVAGHALDALAEVRRTTTDDDVLRCEARAADRADALALALTAFGASLDAGTPDAPRVHAVRAESVDGDAVGAFARAVVALANRGLAPSAVTLCSLEGGSAQGRVLTRARALDSWALVDVTQDRAPRGWRVGLAFSRRITEG